jgi:hypothetical protein
MQGQYNDDVTKLHSVNVDLSQGAAAIKQKLESAGVSWASQIPDIPVVINLTGQADLQAIAGYYDLLNTLGTWLPWVALLLLLASILIAPSRLTGLARAGFWVAVSLLVLVVGAAIGREWLVGQSPLQPQVTEAFVASLLAGLRDQVRALIGLAAVIAAVSWLFGRSRSATSLRRQAGQAAGLVRDPRWQLAVRAGAGAAAVALIIWLLSMDEPRVLWAVLLVLLAGLAAFVALRPGEPATADAAGGAAGGADAGGGPADTRELVPVVDDRPTSPGVPPVTPTSGSSGSSASSADRPS